MGRSASGIARVVDRLASLAALVGLLASAGPARGDRVVLRDGGEIVGKVESEGEEGLVIALPGGGRVTVAPDQVDRRVAESPSAAQYAAIVRRMPDTAEGHWRMAEWCRKMDLDEQYKAHLEQVLRHAPDHEKAREALGYHRQDGHWVRPEERLESAGLIRHQGRWRMAQEVEREAAKDEQREAQGAWYRKIRLWRRWLESSRAAEGEANIANIEDPVAGAVLLKMYADEENPRVRELYLRTAGRLQLPQLPQVLIQAALFDADSHVRNWAVSELKRIGDPHVASAVRGSLKHRDNQVINRAGYLLGQLHDRSTVPDLIEALTTVHRFQLPSGPNMQATFGRGPTGGAALNGFGAGDRPKFVDRELQNQSVHQALVKLTGVDFGYSKAAWWDWYAAQRLPETVNLRRSR